MCERTKKKKTKKLFRNFAHSYLGIDWRDLFKFDYYYYIEVLQTRVCPGYCCYSPSSKAKEACVMLLNTRSNSYMSSYSSDFDDC